MKQNVGYMAMRKQQNSTKKTSKCDMFITTQSSKLKLFQ